MYILDEGRYLYRGTHAMSLQKLFCAKVMDHIKMTFFGKRNKFQLLKSKLKLVRKKVSSSQHPKFSVLFKR